MDSREPRMDHWVSGGDVAGATIAAASVCIATIVLAVMLIDIKRGYLCRQEPFLPYPRCSLDSV
jgi:hypothetical protein